MLDQNATGLNSEKQRRSTQLRHGQSLATLVEHATLTLGVDRSVFLRSAIATEAQRIIEESSRHVLTAEDARLFATALDTPPAPTQRALKAAASCQWRVARAD